MTDEEIKEQCNAVITEAMSWVAPKKTAYHHGSAMKGVGVSCSTFIASVFNAAIDTHLTVVDHVEQWYLNAKEQLYLDNLKVQGFVEIERSEVREGDLVVSNTIYEVYCHSGIIQSWPKPAPVIHVTRNGVERVKTLWSSWYFAQKPSTHKFFRWGGWM
jgi:hypothetical protein